MTAQAFHKAKKAEHNWTVVYTDSVSNKEVKFTCSNAMKRSHEIMMKDSPFVKNVRFIKGAN